MKSFRIFYIIIAIISLQECKILNFSDKQRLPEKSQIVLDQKIKRVSVNTSITHFNLFDTYERDGNTYLLLINKKINQKCNFIHNYSPIQKLSTTFVM